MILNIFQLLKRHVIRHNVSLSRYGNEGVKGVWHGALLNAFIDNAIANGESGYNKIDALEGHIKPVRIGNTCELRFTFTTFLLGRVYRHFLLCYF